MWMINQLQQIHFLQQAIEQPRLVSKLFLAAPPKDRVPLLFYLMDGTPFKAYGDIGKTAKGACFTTSFFSIEDISKDLRVTLQLLKPYDTHKMLAADIESTSFLEKSSSRVEVHAGLFDGMQILDPRLIN
ncbi:hypothetical protein A3781_14265 [Bacillus badius]|nr:hypothetical protein A3781_14265 [Bacillus badius]